LQTSDGGHIRRSIHPIGLKQPDTQERGVAPGPVFTLVEHFEKTQSHGSASRCSIVRHPDSHVGIYQPASPLFHISSFVYTRHLLSTNRWYTPGEEVPRRKWVGPQRVMKSPLLVFRRERGVSTPRIGCLRSIGVLTLGLRFTGPGDPSGPLFPNFTLCIYTGASPLSSTNICIYRTATHLLSTNRWYIPKGGLHASIQRPDRITRWPGWLRRRASGSRPAPSAGLPPNARAPAARQ